MSKRIPPPRIVRGAHTKLTDLYKTEEFKKEWKKSMEAEREAVRPNAELGQLRIDVARLKEAISPGRVGRGIDYYVKVAERMRRREGVIHPKGGSAMNSDGCDVPGICIRKDGHDGPCNGLPRKECMHGAAEAQL